MKITYYIAPLVLAGALTACDSDNNGDSLEQSNNGVTTNEQRERTQPRNDVAQAGEGGGSATGGAGVGSGGDSREGLYNTPEERGVNDAEDVADDEEARETERRTNREEEKNSEASSDADETTRD